MSAVMLTGMLPPLIIWLTMLITHIFNDEERKQKWSCLFNGLCIVSEIAIPYMQKNNYTIHYPCIVASAIAGAWQCILDVVRHFHMVVYGQLCLLISHYILYLV